VYFIGNAAAAVQLQDPARHVVKEVPVVRHGHHASLEVGQVTLQPGHALRVQVVGGLVQQQHVRLLQQHPTQRHPALLTAG
jgi:hypothetical protein